MNYYKKGLFYTLFCICIFSVFFSCKNNTKNISHTHYAGLSTYEKFNYYILSKNLEYHYRNSDSIRKKAVSFLLNNARFHYFINSNINEILIKTISENTTSPTKLAFEIDKLTHSIAPQYEIESDAIGLTTSFLISNIESSMTNYRKTGWYNTLSTDKFCNYILPYRLGKEPSSDWRSYFSDAFYKENKKDILKTDMMSAARVVYQWMYNKKKTFKIRPGATSLGLPDLPPSYLDKLEDGTCHELSAIGVAALRSLGFPATRDISPYYLNRGSGHEWTSIVYKNNKPILFDITSNTFNEPRDRFKYSKVYRTTFEPAKNNHVFQRGVSKYLPDFLNDPFLADVTNEYTTTSDVIVPISHRFSKKNQFFYLAVFGTESWLPVAWSKVHDSKCVFSNVGRDGIYLPVSIDENKITPVGNPICVKADGEAINISLPVINNTESVILKRKYPKDEAKEVFTSRMIGGVFQASNSPDFKEHIDLYKVEKNPGEYYNIINISNKDRYRYYRYYSGLNSFGNIAELGFYKSLADSLPLKGKIIGTSGAWGNSTASTSKAAFDGNFLTYFDAPYPDNAWLGLDFREKVNIGKIKFMARNDLNGVQINDEYELLYWDNKWISMGSKIANDTAISFDGVPKNALLWLRDLTTGSEERIFTYQDGKQIWW